MSHPKAFNSERLKNSRLNTFTKQSEYSADDVSQEKMAVSKFLIYFSMVKEDTIRMPIDRAIYFLSLLNYLAPSGNAESALRRLDYSMDDKNVTSALYKLYLGELVQVNDAKKRHMMAPERLRIQIVKMLLKGKYFE